jgi:hypothetical protein
MIINLNTKMGYAYNMKSKCAESVKTALTKFFTSVKGIKSMTSDEDAAYTSHTVVELFNQHHIQLFTTTDEDHHTLGVVNRFIRTIRDMVFTLTKERQISVQNMKQAIDTYNHSLHKATGFRPIEMTEEQEQEFIQKKIAETAQVPGYDFKMGDRVQIVLAPKPLEKVRARLSLESYIIDGKEGRSYWVKAKDQSVDKVPGFRLVKCRASVPFAATLKKNKRGVVEEILDYNAASDQYHLRYEDKSVKWQSAQDLREGNPTALTYMEKRFWVKKCPHFPIGVPLKILALVPKKST